MSAAVTHASGAAAVTQTGPGGASVRVARVTWSLVLAAAALAAPTAAVGQHVPDLSELRGLSPAADLFAPRMVDGMPVPPPDRARAVASGWSVRAMTASGPPTDGSLRILVVLAAFADSEDPPRFSQDDVQAALFDGPSDRGTVSQLYAEMSRGALQVGGVVTAWVRSPMTLAQVRGGDLNGGEPPRTGEFLMGALDAVDAGLDLGQFDNDGPDGLPNSGDDNGLVDAVFFLYGEVGEHCGGNGPWPHFGGIAPWNEQEPWRSADDERPDGTTVGVNPYVLSTVVDCAGQEIGAVGVAAHELGHVVGLPDLYHPSPIPNGHLAVNRRWVVGCWDLMAAGAWGCGPADQTTGRFGPTGFSAWSKDRLGWLQPVHVVGTAGVEFELDPVHTSGVALVVPLDDVGDESYMVEYRPQEGFDQDLPAGGVLIYHRSETGVHWPDSTQHYRVSVVEADANGALQKRHEEGGNRGEAGDAWARDGADDRFSAATTPATALFSGAEPGVTFHSIRVEGGRAYVRISTTPAPTLSASTLVAPFLGAGTPPSDDQADLLDIEGNRNGVYDVGDVRARLVGR